MREFLFEKESDYKKLIPDFDSSSSMLYSLSNYLFGREEAVGLPPKMPQLLGDVLNLTPQALRTSAYKASGKSEAGHFSDLREFRDEDISKWIIEAYPKQKYPAVMIGSSSGAVTHMCAMMGIPWIPQTVMIALSRKMDPDELVADIEWGKKAAGIMSETLPDFKFHQMHDPIQDRVMVSNMAYFRIKRLKLGEYLKAYLKEALIPGGTIFISDCTYKWPSYHVDGEHYFQTGGLGDVGGYEYMEGSHRIKEFLKREGSKRSSWNVPDPQEDIPEAEWGFDPRLAENIKDFASSSGFNVKTLSFDHPQDPSPVAADLAGKWYKKNGISERRLLVECFALLEPLWSAKTASVPYWLAFNTTSSYERLIEYVKKTDDFEEIYLMVMSNAVEGIGTVPVEKWQDLLKKAGKKASFIGVDPQKYPYDMGSFIKYFKDLKKKIKARHFLPERISVDEFCAFMLNGDKECVLDQGEE